jgi:hypothetical protein
MRLIQITGIFSLLLILLLTSCNETPKPFKSDPFYDKLKEGKATSEELDSLMESHGVMGSYTVKVPKADFEVTFPVRKVHVKESVVIQIIDGKEVEIISYSANMQSKNDKNLAYQISYNFVDDVRTDADIKELFDDQQAYYSSALNCTVEVENSIDLNGVPGRFMYMTVDDSKLKLTQKMYYHKGVFYRLMVVTHDGNLFNKSISEFLKSFKILDKK